MWWDGISEVRDEPHSYVLHTATSISPGRNYALVYIRVCVDAHLCVCVAHTCGSTPIIMQLHLSLSLCITYCEKWIKTWAFRNLSCIHTLRVYHSSSPVYSFSCVLIASLGCMRCSQYVFPWSVIIITTSVLTSSCQGLPCLRHTAISLSPSPSKHITLWRKKKRNSSLYTRTYYVYVCDEASWP